MFGNSRSGRRVRPLKSGNGHHASNPVRLAKVGVALLGVAATVAVIQYGGPPFTYRLGQRPQREIRAKVAFQKIDVAQTDYRRDLAAEAVPPICTHDPKPVDDLQQSLRHLFDTIAASKPDELPAVLATEWRLKSETIATLHSAVAAPESRKVVDRALDQALQPLRSQGVLDLSAQPSEAAIGKMIQVVGPSDPAPFPVEVSAVDRPALTQPDGPLFGRIRSAVSSAEVAAALVHLIVTGSERMPGTLTYDPAATARARDAARQSVAELVSDYKPGTKLVDQDQIIDEEKLDLLRREHAASLAQWKPADVWRRTGSLAGLVAALYALAWYYVMRFEPRAAATVVRTALLVFLIVIGLAVARAAGTDPWRAESVPITLAAMTVAIAYSQQFALLIAFGMALCCSWAFGTGVSDLVVLAGSSATAILALTQVRTRTKLIYVGVLAGVTHFALTWATGLMAGQPTAMLIDDSLRRLGWSVLTGFLMGGSLPFLESLFGIITDISLLELSDVTHPLLQELVRRAPGTYSHSVSVATIGEAAAERIGAHALLVRVGAYFHDIGKMLKPHYFIENQGDSVNRHESLNPAMSTLIIIGHVKDGIDLAHQHHLPSAIIDFIAQHHGTTLVQYFYEEAAREANGDWERESEAEESSFRYPGPKPQTRETGVLMLADAVEGASRTLVDPTPARIEGLVHDIAMARLLDGQFDECGLTLREIHQVEESLTKSLIAIYHARIKYPERRPA
jgi:hypothetical protein